MEKFKFHGYIYITINQQTKKCYVGQKSISPDKSKNYLGSGARFRNSVKKYGETFFKKIILGEIFSNDIEDFKRQLNEAETECIYFFRVYGSDGENHDEVYGYNLTKEGGSTLGLPKEILNTAIKNGLETKKLNPNIMKKAGKKQSKTKSLKSEEEKEIVKKKQSNNWKNKSEQEKKLKNKNISHSKIKTKKGKFNNHYKYKKLDCYFILNLYFTCYTWKQIINEYNLYFNEKIGSSCLSRFFNILNLPQTSHRSTQEYIIKNKFIEENKHKIDWYVENYERLENEYFEKKHYEKHKNVLDTNI